ncbi:MAG: sulfite exporter TauE/SafE family protein, partial [Chloroflexota bacterium]
GIVATIAYARKGSISWDLALWLSVGIIPATFFGAKVNSLLPSSLLIIILGGLIIFSGINALLKRKTPTSMQSSPGKIILILIGLFVGFGSALTGTGGPVILVPILVFLNMPPLKAIGVSQAIQIPVALFSSAGFFLYGQIDYQLGITLGVLQIIGVLIGTKIAHTLPVNLLRKIVAISLISVGGLLIFRIF